MSITDELREELAICVQNNWMTTATRKEFLAIADRIDAAHNRALMEIRNRAIDQGFDEGFASADDWLAQHEDAMAEHGWMRLPKDADGEYIHVGDTMDSKVDYLFDGKPFTVRAIVLCEDGWEVADGRFGNQYEPDSLHHHHKTTVEDVLREMCLEIDRRCERGSIDYDKLFAEYAAKLRLAGDGDD